MLSFLHFKVSSESIIQHLQTICICELLCALFGKYWWKNKIVFINSTTQQEMALIFSNSNHFFRILLTLSDLHTLY